jgi:tetratricopeptide (TPR) repeat protein
MNDWERSETFTCRQEKRQKISHLHRLAKECYEDNQYVKAEKLYSQAFIVAEQIDDLSLKIKSQFWLAVAQDLQGKHQEALAAFTSNIEVAYSKDLIQGLSDEDLMYIAGSFRRFVDSGIRLPEMPITDLEHVIDRGLDWLENVGKRNWTEGFRMMRGQLWQQQKRLDVALAEMEAALALRRRHSLHLAFALGTHLISVANLLQEMEQIDEAIIYYQEVIEGDQYNQYDACRAWKGIAQIAIKQQKWDVAERYAQKSLDLARETESPQLIRDAYTVLGDVYWQQCELTFTITAKIQAWQYARQYKSASDLYEAYRDFGKIRLQQARQSSPHQRIPKAQQWLQRSMPLALRLDRQVNSTDRQTLICSLQEECAALLATENET